MSKINKKSKKTRLTIKDIAKFKANDKAMVCLTAYTAPMAKILDKYVDLMLVGDSVGMVLYGMESTLGVSLNMMINHGKAVVRASSHAFIVVDMPFGSYEQNKEQAFKNAAKIMSKTGCQAVKLEGGSEMVTTIEFLSKRGIPVMAHVGLTPQSVNAIGGYKTRGRTKDEAERILKDAIAVSKAGAFAVVIEGTAEPLAKEITEEVDIPTIGIGASVACDGQILVTDDMLGLFQDFTPKFVKKYSDMAGLVSSAVRDYSNEVRNRKFPSAEHIVK